MRFSFWHWQNVLMEADGGGADGGAAPAMTNTIAAAADAALKEAGVDGAPEAYYPDGLEETFRGANDRETIDKLFADFKGRTAAEAYHPEGLAEALRGANDRETIDKLVADIASRPAPPEKPDGYTLELSEDFSKRFGVINEKDNAVLDIWRQTAHELGLGNAQFNGAFERFYSNLDKAGLIDQVDPKAEFGKLVEAQPQNIPHVDRVQRAAKFANDVDAGLKALESSNVLTKPQAALLAGLLDTADGIGTVHALLSAMGGRGLQPGSSGGGDAGTDHERSMRAMYPSMFKS